MTGRGIIIAKQGDMVQIEVQPASNCSSCKACIGIDKKSFLLAAHNDIAADVGEEVYFSVRPHRVVGYSLLIFILPLMMMVGGYFFGMSCLPQPQTVKEGFAILTAIMGLIFGFLLVKGYDTFWAKRHQCIARVIGRTSQMDFEGFLCN